MAVSGNASSGPTPARAPKIAGVRGRQKPERPQALVSTRGQWGWAREARTDEPSMTSPTAAVALAGTSNRANWSGGGATEQRIHPGASPAGQSDQTRLTFIALTILPHGARYICISTDNDQRVETGAARVAAGLSCPGPSHQGHARYVVASRALTRRPRTWADSYEEDERTGYG